jgi:hypothetical protein
VRPFGQIALNGDQKQRNFSIIGAKASSQGDRQKLALCKVCGEANDLS